MPYLAICLCAFLTSGLTLFPGGGLGTLLLPVMAVILTACARAFLGNRPHKKVTCRGLQLLVALMLLRISLGRGMGLI